MSSILYNMITKSILVTIVAMLSVNFLPDHLFVDFPMEPRHIQPIKYETVIPKWNNQLSNPKNHPEFIQLNNILGPESIAVSKSGLYYTGLADGRLVELDPNNKFKLRQVLRFKSSSQCKDMVSTREQECGRLLQLRFVNGTLYAIEASTGLYKIDVRSGTKTHLGPRSSGPVAGPRIFNSFAFDPENPELVYLSVSSTKWTLQRIIWSIVDLDDSGELLVMNIKTGKTSIIFSNLMMPNGIDVDLKRDRLLFAETTAAQVNYVALKDVRRLAQQTADKAKMDSIVKQNLIPVLPGNPDNIVIVNEIAYIALPFIRANGPEVIDKLSAMPGIRKALSRLMYAVGHGLGYIQDRLYQHPTLELISSELKCGHTLYRVMKTDQAALIKYDLSKGSSEFFGSDTYGFISEVVPDGKGNLLVGSFRSAFLVKVKDSTVVAASKPPFSSLNERPDLLLIKA